MSLTPASVPTPAPDARAMARSLGRLLDQVRGAREVLPHLAALERGLISQGVLAIENIPPHWLARITSQLASLPLPVDEEPLHALLRGLSERLNPVTESKDNGLVWEPPTGFDAERTLVVNEISHSEFMAVSDQQATTMPAPLSMRD